MFKTAHQLIILSFCCFIGKRRRASFPWSTLKTCQTIKWGQIRRSVAGRGCTYMFYNRRRPPTGWRLTYLKWTMMGAELGERALHSEKSRLDLIQDKVIIGSQAKKWQKDSTSSKRAIFWSPMVHLNAHSWLWKSQAPRSWIMDWEISTSLKFSPNLQGSQGMPSSVAKVLGRNPWGQQAKS